MPTPRQEQSEIQTEGPNPQTTCPSDVKQASRTPCVSCQDMAFLFPSNGDDEATIRPKTVFSFHQYLMRQSPLPNEWSALAAFLHAQACSNTEEQNEEVGDAVEAWFDAEECATENPFDDDGIIKRAVVSYFKRFPDQFPTHYVPNLPQAASSQPRQQLSILSVITPRRPSVKALFLHSACDDQASDESQRTPLSAHFPRHATPEPTQITEEDTVDDEVSQTELIPRSVDLVPHVPPPPYCPRPLSTHEAAVDSEMQQIQHTESDVAVHVISIDEPFNPTPAVSANSAPPPSSVLIYTPLQYQQIFVVNEQPPPNGVFRAPFSSSVQTSLYCLLFLLTLLLIALPVAKCTRGINMRDILDSCIDGVVEGLSIIVDRMGWIWVHRVGGGGGGGGAVDVTAMALRMTETGRGCLQKGAYVYGTLGRAR
ncbi:hypothetical protein DFH27DRAFT_652129 [Peziza echinospora]|nr:hypothetical protein DFH27DRAFT_652129 [Peziza echinospora]